MTVQVYPTSVPEHILPKVPRNGGHGTLWAAGIYGISPERTIILKKIAFDAALLDPIHVITEGENVYVVTRNTHRQMFNLWSGDDIRPLTEAHALLTAMKHCMNYRPEALLREYSAKLPVVMGILNVTPDSFSDGGRYIRTADAVQHALTMAEDGADIIDVGGESTRPGSAAVTEKEELRRVIPVIKGILKKNSSLCISVDTTKAAVARAALEAGARIVNDISGGTFEPEIMSIAAEHGAAFIVMHIQGKPKTMQHAPVYAEVTREVYQLMHQQVKAAHKCGLKKIIVDPGIGFGKTFEHNANLLRHFDSFKSLGLPIMLGISRKSFFQQATGAHPGERDVPGVVAEALAVQKGAALIRTHNPKYANYIRQLNSLFT